MIGGLAWLWLAAVTVLGACVGSFINVLVYRLPRGQGVVYPPSGCPACGTRLSARENIPVIGWMLLRGRCRYCGDRISVGYPLVEATTAVLFGGWFAVCYLTHLRPGMSGPGLPTTLLIFLVHLVLLGGLFAATVIDAKHFIVPLQIPWSVTAVAAIVLPLSATLFPMSLASRELRPGEPLEAIAEPYRYAAAVRAKVRRGGEVVVSALPFDRRPGVFFGASGAMVGLLVAAGLVRKRWLPGSFDEGPTSETAPPPDSEMAAGSAADSPTTGDGPTADGSDGAQIEGGAEEEERTAPERSFRPRHEMLKETIFLLFPVVGWIGGSFLPIDFAGWPEPAQRAAWVVAGVLTGYLVGGAVLWTTRLLGTTWLNQEALGLGDVHLLAAVGAVAGWEVTLLAFFVAPFIALTFLLIAEGIGRLFRRRVRVIPYGPHLAAATVVVMVFREPIVTVVVDYFTVRGPL